MDYHPSGRELPRNIAKSITRTESSLPRYVSSGMEYANPEAPPPRGNHPLGRALPRNIAKSMKERTDSSLPGYASSGVDAQTKKETEADDPVNNMETHEEFFDPLSEKESEKGYSKKDTDPRYLYNHNKTSRSQAGETR